MQLSLDGLEGNWSSGMGQYGCSLFTKAWYDALTPAQRERFINDASNPHHFTWHISTRYNWGEPWYAGFRESQTIYRLKNQLFYTRNLIPRMLGWFSLRAETTLEDAEWLCARAAGYDAGFALATSFDSKATQSSSGVSRVEGKKGEILDAIRQWETARQGGAFTERLKPAPSGCEPRIPPSRCGAGPVGSAPNRSARAGGADQDRSGNRCFNKEGLACGRCGTDS
jgi:hypothetical protein